MAKRSAAMIPYMMILLVRILWAILFKICLLFPMLSSTPWSCSHREHTSE